MTLLKQQFSQLINSKLEKNEYKIYPTAGGEVALANDGKTAIVWTDGRYPTMEQGYSLNQTCIEVICVLYGCVVLEIDGILIYLDTGDSYKIETQKPYSLAGKCVCSVKIIGPDNTGWDSTQNSFVQIEERN